MRRFFAGVALGLLLSISGTLLSNRIALPPQKRPTPPPTAELKVAEERLQPDGRPLPAGRSQPVYILVMGVDERPQDSGRSDTMFLVRAGGGQLRALSLPRDTRVEIEGVGEAKLNAAYAYGGPELAKQTVSRLLGLPINHYVKVDLKGFRKVVDLIGGVPFHVESAMHYEDPADGLVIDLQPGHQLLDGRMAEQYVRFRSDAIGDDLGRIRRQQAFLKAAARQALQPSNLPRLPSLLYTAGKQIETDLPPAEQLRLARTAFQAQQAGAIISETLPGHGEYVGGISYFLPDAAELDRLLQIWRGP